VPGVIRASLSVFGRNTAGVAELLNVVTRATISPSDTAVWAGVAALDNATEGVVVIIFPDGRN
jgi:hypothetical protein